MNKKLQDAIAKRDQFLKDRPDMIPYQQEIDNIMDSCPESERMEVLSIMITSKLQDLLTEFARLQNILGGVVDNT